MFRTVVVNFGEKLSIKDNWLIITTAGENSNRRHLLGWLIINRLI